MANWKMSWIEKARRTWPSISHVEQWVFVSVHIRPLQLISHSFKNDVMAAYIEKEPGAHKDNEYILWWWNLKNKQTNKQNSQDIYPLFQVSSLFFYSCASTKPQWIEQVLCEDLWANSDGVVKMGLICFVQFAEQSCWFSAECVPSCLVLQTVFMHLPTPRPLLCCTWMT